MKKPPKSEGRPSDSRRPPRPPPERVVRQRQVEVIILRPTRHALPSEVEGVIEGRVAALKFRN